MWNTTGLQLSRHPIDRSIGWLYDRNPGTFPRQPSRISEVLAASRSLASRAAQTLVLFMTAVLIAVFLVAPQPAAALGAELLAVAVASGTGLLILDRRAGHRSEQDVARYIERFSPNTITAVLVGVAGLTFLVKAGGGLYWLIPAGVASLAGGVVNAWLFLARVTGES
jgi:hypothetical protein